MFLATDEISDVKITEQQVTTSYPGLYAPKIAVASTDAQSGDAQGVN